jgi:hypothetical protein
MYFNLMSIDTMDDSGNNMWIVKLTVYIKLDL